MVSGLGERLQQQRESMHISQKEVAAALNVSPSIISNYENGERTPSVENLMALARIYCCTTDYLLGIEKTNRYSLDTNMLTESQIKMLQQFLYEFDKQRSITPERT